MHFRNELIEKEAGLINGKLYRIPNRSFLPSNLYQSVCEGSNLDMLGSKLSKLTAGAIAFGETDADAAVIGEFYERYCSTIYDSSMLVRGAYEDIVKIGNALHPDEIILYAGFQYEKEGFLASRLRPSDEINWVLCHDLMSNNEPCYVPAFLIFFGYRPDCFERVHIFNTTTTGLAAGPTPKHAIQGGFCECAERHAFCNFWYNQNRLRLPQYSPSMILEAFGDDPKIANLYDNPAVQMKIFDLSPISCIEAAVVFMYFKYKGKVYQSTGSAAAFDKRQSLMKAALEAYQGVDYAIMLYNKQLWGDQKKLNDFDSLDSFEKHFAYYNNFPEHRKEVPVIRDAMNFEDVSDKIFFKPNEKKITSLQDILDKYQQFDFNKVLYYESTTPDAASVNYFTMRVVVPGWAYLTGVHNYPFLGSDIFNENNHLFTRLPHPFP
ncbi:hypothetical protein D0962_15450 [Leptolyngbyaceae cyanobacterium CCMR0082]|uniref:YcaO domain-containing protein n=2 Tax=Adonisia turfae TaxID=2950184 RepID=A0A6M0S6R2_9CYAN|nr:YcaO-like family protein [Adonisia turfae]MDV3353884.1 YcaO-like family protein [Leptothoe sp. LEGE 181152]NEZ54341.1 hypothetical protein [Adonisia turfae CCMR0081]NEZ64168.1 hypothetical protein [Adonisia turfae CCMR0082]